MPGDRREAFKETGQILWVPEDRDARTIARAFFTGRVLCPWHDRRKKRVIFGMPNRRETHMFERALRVGNARAYGDLYARVFGTGRFCREGC